MEGIKTVEPVIDPAILSGKRKMVESDINKLIAHEGIDSNLISDGYHTFGELYEHRVTLWIALCKCVQSNDYSCYNGNGVIIDNPVWRTLLHSDGSRFDGWFVLGCKYNKGEQMTYHLPISEWDNCSFAKTLDKAPEFDGHTPNDVLERIKKLF